MPKAWPPLTADEIGECLRALGCVQERTRSTHQTWVHPRTRRIGVVDVKWNPVSGPTLKHLVVDQLGFSREQFYGATSRAAKKLR